MARAIARRWRWPPLSSKGERFAHSGDKPTSSIRSHARSEQVAPAFAMLNFQRLCNDLRCREARIQGSRGILEYHLNPGAQWRESPFAPARYLVSFKPDFAAVGLFDHRQTTCQGGLSGARFVDQRGQAAGSDFQIDVGQSVDLKFISRKRCSLYIAFAQPARSHEAGLQRVRSCSFNSHG